GCYDVLVGAASRDSRDQGVIGQGGCTTPPACSAAGAAAVKPRGRGLGISFARSSNRPAQVDIRSYSSGRRITAGGLVARFAGMTGPFTWDGKPNRTLPRL